MEETFYVESVAAESRYQQSGVYYSCLLQGQANVSHRSKIPATNALNFKMMDEFVELNTTVDRLKVVLVGEANGNFCCFRTIGLFCNVFRDYELF